MHHKVEGQFYDKMAYECNLQRSGEMILELEDFNGHVGKYINFEGMHGKNGFEIRSMEGKMLLEFCDKKELCVANIWFHKKKRHSDQEIIKPRLILY